MAIATTTLTTTGSDKATLWRAAIPLVAILLLFSSCHPKSRVIEASIEYYPTESQFQTLPSAFPPLTRQELAEDWGKELMIGTKFGQGLDLYRAITSFKRAQFLCPRELVHRRQQIAYGIVLAYYLGRKYQDALDAFEKSELSEITSRFPTIKDLFIILSECYRKTNQMNKVDTLMEMIEQLNDETATNLKLANAISEANFLSIQKLACESSNKQCIDTFLYDFHRKKKSVSKAQFLNAVLPGAGYYYIGQTQSAITSLTINALFTWAAYQFFHQNNIAAGIITTSLEMGWYLGGINGAGLEAKYYNERLYNRLGKDTMINCGIFPVIMLQTSF